MRGSATIVLHPDDLFRFLTLSVALGRITADFDESHDFYVLFIFAGRPLRRGGRTARDALIVERGLGWHSSKSAVRTSTAVRFDLAAEQMHACDPPARR
jgi:hypothetical protein